MAQLQTFAATDVGLKREHNEDAYLDNKRLGLVAVADGMGGHAAGEIASQLALETLDQTLSAQRAKGVPRPDEVLEWMESAIQRACEAVHQNSLAYPERGGMGTTLSALWLHGNRGYIAHVGDSRIYLIRRAQIHQLTEDHSLMNEAIRKKLMTPEQVEKTGKKNALTRAVGVYPNVEVDTLSFDVAAGDIFIACSDGLHRYLEQGELSTLLAEDDVSHWAQTLTTYANQCGGEDNISVVVVQIPEVEGLATVEDLSLQVETLQAMPLFQHLTYRELMSVLSRMVLHNYQDGEGIVQEGEKDYSLYMVLSGSVRVHRGTTEIAALSSGEHFGEMSLIEKMPRSASVTSIGASRLLALSRGAFADIIRCEKRIAIKLLLSFVGVLSARLRTTSHDLSETKATLEEIVYDTFELQLDE